MAAAAMAIPAITDALSKEQGGITGVFDSVMMKPFYIIFTVLLIISIIVIMAGKYLPGFILLIFSGGVLFATFYLRSYKIGKSPLYGKWDGGDEMLPKETCIRELYSILMVQPPDISDNTNYEKKTKVLLQTLYDNEEMIKKNYNLLTEEKRYKVNDTIEQLNDEKLKKILMFNKYE